MGNIALRILFLIILIILDIINASRIGKGECIGFGFIITSVLTSVHIVIMLSEVIFKINIYAKFFGGLNV